MRFQVLFNLMTVVGGTGYYGSCESQMVFQAFFYATSILFLFGFKPPLPGNSDAKLALL